MRPRGVSDPGSTTSPRQDDEAREVVLVVLNALVKDLHAIQLCTARGADGSTPNHLLPRDHLRCASGVVDRLARNIHRPDVAVALCQRLCKACTQHGERGLHAYRHRGGRVLHPDRHQGGVPCMQTGIEVGESCMQTGIKAGCPACRQASRWACPACRQASRRGALHADRHRGGHVLHASSTVGMEATTVRPSIPRQTSSSGVLRCLGRYMRGDDAPTVTGPSHLRMAHDRGDVLLLGSRQHHQAVVDLERDLTNHVQPVPQHQIVHRVNGAP
eukprot:360762-Chlamydomonas_euryale.AAC.13